MRHNRETQTDSDDVPFTYRPNGIYYYKKRIPTDLVRAGVYGKKKEEKQSLKTSDPCEARLAASRVNAAFEEQWNQDRKKLEKRRNNIWGKNRPKIVHRTNQENMRELSILSASERKGLIIAHFISREKQALMEKEPLKAAGVIEPGATTKPASVSSFIGATRWLKAGKKSPDWCDYWQPKRSHS